MKLYTFAAALCLLAACKPSTTATDSNAAATATNASATTTTPAATAYTDNAELMQFLKDSLANAASFEDLVADKAPSKQGCFVPDNSLAHNCGYLSKFEVKDTVFLFATNLPQSSTVFLDKLYALSPAGKLYYDAEMNMVLADGE